jgi:hypothetical protein
MYTIVLYGTVTINYPVNRTALPSLCKLTFQIDCFIAYRTISDAQATQHGVEGRVIEKDEK